MTEKHQCAGRVRISGMWPRFRNCIRPAKNHEEGKYWCAQHTPSLIKARDAERTASRNAEWAAMEQASKRAVALAAARAAVVEAAKVFVGAPSGHGSEVAYYALQNSVDHMRRLERDHA